MINEGQLRKLKDFSAKLCLAGRFDESVKNSQAAIDMLDADNSFPEKNKAAWTSAFLSLIAGTHLANKNPSLAEEFFQKALDIQAALPKSANLAYAIDNLAKAQELSGNILASLQNRLAALEILKEFSPQSAGLLSAKYSKIADDYDAIGHTKEADDIRKYLPRES